MSSYLGRYGVPEDKTTAQAEYEKVMDEKRTQRQIKGSRYTGKRTGFRSLMDQNAIVEQMMQYQAKHQSVDGKMGVYTLRVMKDDGTTAAPNATINIGGRLFRSGGDGNLRILDSEYINDEIVATKEIREYEEKIVEAILVSDTMAEHILGDNFEYLKGSEDKGPLKGVSKTLRDVDASPNVIRYYDPTSVTYAQAIAKIRAIVHNSGSIIINEEAGALHGGSGSGVARASTSGHDERA